MNKEEAFKILEIAPTSDRKEIKKAYAALVKKYHPEEYPEEWKRIHDAYDVALKWIENSGRGELQINDGILTEETDKTQIHWENEIEISEENSEQQEFAALFDNLEELSADAKKQQIEEQRRQLKEAVNFLVSMRNKKRTNIKEWQAFFNNEKYQWAIGQDEVITELGCALGNKTINKELHEYLKKQLQMIRQYNQSMQDTKNRPGVFGSISFASMKIDSAYQRKIKRRKSIRKKLIIIFSFIILLLLGLSGRDKNRNTQAEQDFLMENYDQILNIQKEEQNQQMDGWIETLSSTNSKKSYEMLLKGIQMTDESYQREKLKDGICLRDGVYLNDLWEKPDEAAEKFNFSEMAIDEIEMTNGTLRALENAYAFRITTSGESRQLILCCNPIELGFSESCRIYYLMDGKYVEILEWSGQRISDDLKVRYWFRLLDYQVFVIDVSADTEKEDYCVVMTGDKFAATP